MPLFDDYLVCDWSAANTPKSGKDSIWIATAARRGDDVRTTPPVNIRTRSEAMAHVREAALRAMESGRRLLAGFDFAFGYPAGTARRVVGKPDWRALWQALARLVEDDDTNASNRFEVAGFINRSCFDETPGPFWGHPAGRTYDGLGTKRPPCMPDGIAERRLCEEAMNGTQPVWKLAYTGAVGSQTLLGIARLEALRHDETLAGNIAVWPFETGFADTIDKPVTLAEIYPSAFPVSVKKGEIKDAAQVRTLAAAFARLDAEDALARLLGAPPGLDEQVRRTVLAEEGWILGAGLLKMDKD